MSPYLFLLCVEVLSQMLDWAKFSNQMQGMRLVRGCPRISHLFFADDSLFFCRATLGDVNCLASILAQYEQISVQKVNYEKSSIIFGKRILPEVRIQVHHILKINTVGGGGGYLGLPEQFSRSKVLDFQGIVQNVKNQIQPWYNQYLSPAGKEILIKSLLQAKPGYSMSCFLLPKTVCDEINSLLSGFWWGQKDGKRKISWISWKRLCLPKKEGGMGFRDLRAFNIALLAK